MLAGPNGSGKTTLARRVLEPVTHLPFVNRERRSFLTETVFSHPSKLELIVRAQQAGYLVVLHVVLVPEDLAVARVADRVGRGGHAVPEEKVRERYSRLWLLVSQARACADRTYVYDNSTAATPFRLVAQYEHGGLVGEAHYPTWTPPALTS